MSTATQHSEQVAPLVATTGAEAPARPWLPAFVVVAVLYLVTVEVLRRWMMARNGGPFAYTMDDTYIHLSIADTLVHHGTWGVDPGVYESASSSPLWTLLVAAGLVVLPVADLWVPLVLSVAVGLVVVWQVARLDPFRSLGPAARWIGLVATGLALGLLHMTFVAMEHVLHAALALAIVLVTAALARDRGNRRLLWILTGLLAVATLVRFETLFLAAGVAVALVAVPEGGRPWRAGLVGRVRGVVPLLAAAVLPVAAYAAVNLSFGQYALPNSVTVKTRFASGGPFGFLRAIITPDVYVDAFGKLAKPETSLILMGLAAALVLALTPRGRELVAVRVTALAVLVATGLNALFGEVGGRYTVYVTAAGLGVLFPLAAAAPEHLRRVRGVPLAAVVLALVVLAVPVQLLRTSWLATAGSERYRQHGQVAEFLARAYPDDTVAIEELGYASWLHDGPDLDLLGLASIDVARAFKHDRYDAAFLEDIVRRRQARAVVVYPQWFDTWDYELPASWVPVERWCLEGGPLQSVLFHCMTWYGPTPGDAAVLRDRLDRYRSLPDGVRVEPLDGGQPAG